MTPVQLAPHRQLHVNVTAKPADCCWMCAGADSAGASLLAARSNRNRMRSQAEADLAELEKKREELHGLLGRRD